MGFFGLELADALEAFIGVEVDHNAIKSARQNAAARGCRNGQFIQGRAELLLPELLRRFDATATSVLIAHGMSSRIIGIIAAESAKADPLCVVSSRYPGAGLERLVLRRCL